MYYNEKIWIGDADGEKVCIHPKMANRHGLIAGATGTGKTVTLKVLAESFSDAGVPVFLADVKGICRVCAGLVWTQKICRKGSVSSGWQTVALDISPIRRFSGIFTERPVFPSEQPYQRWGRCFWRG